MTDLTQGIFFTSFLRKKAHFISRTISPQWNSFLQTPIKIPTVLLLMVITHDCHIFLEKHFCLCIHKAKIIITVCKHKSRWLHCGISDTLLLKGELCAWLGDSLSFQGEKCFQTECLKLQSPETSNRQVKVADLYTVDLPELFANRLNALTSKKLKRKIYLWNLIQPPHSSTLCIILFSSFLHCIIFIDSMHYYIYLVKYVTQLFLCFKAWQVKSPIRKLTCNDKHIFMHSLETS